MCRKTCGPNNDRLQLPSLLLTLLTLLSLLTLALLTPRSRFLDGLCRHKVLGQQVRSLPGGDLFAVVEVVDKLAEHRREVRFVTGALVRRDVDVQAPLSVRRDEDLRAAAVVRVVLNADRRLRPTGDRAVRVHIRSGGTHPPNGREAHELVANPVQ